MLGHVRSG